MHKIDEEPILYYFVSTPPDMLDHPPLASSLQMFETSMLLISLRRFPAALISCANAWESALKAKLKLKPLYNVSMQGLIERADKDHPLLKHFERKKIDEFRQTRNTLVHYGFSPRDDEECSRLILEIGYPFLMRCYRELFDFCLDWKDLREGVKDFSDLTPMEQGKAGLLPEVADQLRLALQAFTQAQALGIDKMSNCLLTFIKYFQQNLKTEFMSQADNKLAERGENIGIRFDEEEKLKARVEGIFNISWKTDCPVCKGIESVVVELDNRILSDSLIGIRRSVCVTCQLDIPEEAAFLSDILFKEAVQKDRKRIIEEWGIKPGKK